MNLSYTKLFHATYDVIDKQKIQLNVQINSNSGGIIRNKSNRLKVALVSLTIFVGRKTGKHETF